MRAGHLLITTALLVALAATGETDARAVRQQRSAASAARSGAGKKKAAAPKTRSGKTNGALPRAPQAARRSPTTARAARKPAAPARLTRAERESAALDRAREVLAPWIRGGMDIEVLLSPTQIQLKPDNPLLGRGPVEVVVRPKVASTTSSWQRLTSAFRPSRNRRMLVAVNESGAATVLDDTPDAMQHRVGRAITGKIPVQEILHDVVNSKQSRAGLLAVVGSIFTAAVSPEVAVGIGITALGIIRNGVKERRATRDAAFDKTVTWVRGLSKKQDTPALSEAYRFYRSELEKSDTGTRPISFRAFVEKMSFQDLD